MGFDPEPIGALPVGERVPADVANRLLDAAAEALGDEHIGLTLAQRIPIGGFGSLDYGLAASDTVSSALRFLARFYSVATQRVRVEVRDDETTRHIEFPRNEGAPYCRHWVELAISMIALRLQQTLGDNSVAFTVQFRHRAPENTSIADTVFGAPVTFGAPLDSLGIPLAILERPLQTASAMLAEMIERRMQQLAPADPDELVDNVRRTLAAMLDDGTVALDELARRLGTSRRTLQRELTNRQTSHVRLLDELRRTRAHELLDLGLSMAETARRLGYSEPSGLARAYRRWKR